MSSLILLPFYLFFHSLCLPYPPIRPARRICSVSAWIPVHARIYRPSFRENKPETLVFNDWKRAFCTRFQENWVYHWFYHIMYYLGMGSRQVFLAPDNNNMYSQILLMTTNAFHSTTLQRQNTEILKQIFPEKEYWGLSPNFHIHASVSDLYIFTIGLPVLLEEICRPILGLHKSLTDTWMWKLGLRPRYSQKRNTKVGFSLQCSCLFYEIYIRILSNQITYLPFYAHTLSKC